MEENMRTEENGMDMISVSQESGGKSTAAMFTTAMTADQKAMIEEQQLRRRARWLLKNFRKYLDRKHKQEEEMRNTRLYTRDDALYLLSGMSAHKSGERVQTSNISNAPENAVMNVDDTLERMNSEVLAEVSKGYDELCERITIVNVALMLIDMEARCVAKQVYCEGTKRDKVIATDGHYYSKKKVDEMIAIAERAVIDTLEHINHPNRNHWEEELNE